MLSNCDGGLTTLHTCDRPDGKVSYGYALLRGKRSNMEDFHHAQVRISTPRPVVSSGSNKEGNPYCSWDLLCSLNAKLSLER